MYSDPEFTARKMMEFIFMTSAIIILQRRVHQLSSGNDDAFFITIFDRR